MNPQSHPRGIVQASSRSTLGGSGGQSRAGLDAAGLTPTHAPALPPRLRGSAGQVAALGGGGWTEVSAEGLLCSPSPYLTFENLSFKSCYETFLKYIQLECHHKPPRYIHRLHMNVWPTGFISLAGELTVRIRIPLWCPFVVGLSPCL